MADPDRAQKHLTDERSYIEVPMRERARYTRQHSLSPGTVSRLTDSTTRLRESSRLAMDLAQSAQSV